MVFRGNEQCLICLSSSVVLFRGELEFRMKAELDTISDRFEVKSEPRRNLSAASRMPQLAPSFDLQGHCSSDQAQVDCT